LQWLIALGVLAGGVGRHIEDVDPLDVVKTLKVLMHLFVDVMRLNFFLSS
jgi:hypothetical protein